MAIPSTRDGFKNYCKRAIGFGVIDINVSDDQVEDRIDEGLQYFAQYHYDGVERMYLKYKVTEDDVTRARANDTTTATDTKAGNVNASFLEGKNYIPMPSAVVSVIQVFPFDNAVTNNMFDIRYQIRLNDLYDFSQKEGVTYQMTRTQGEEGKQILLVEKPNIFTVPQHCN